MRPNRSIESVAAMRPGRAFAYVPPGGKITCGCCHRYRDGSNIVHPILGHLGTCCGRSFDMRYDWAGESLRTRRESCSICFSGEECPVHS